MRGCGHSDCCYPPFWRAAWSAVTTACTSMVMERRSEYFANLSVDAKLRYEAKVTNAGLTQDPYAIREWTENPENLPEVQWSDNS